MSDTWSSPDADEHGFVSFDLIQEKAARTAREQFVEQFPVPALMAVFGGADPSLDQETIDPNQSGIQLLTVSIKSRSVLRYLGKLAFIAKRPGNPFTHLVSIGRSASNDVAVAVDSVSKVHGYFVRDGIAWSFTDHGSTNGSLIGDRKVEPGEKVLLFDGSVLQLGLEVMLEYLSPEGLYERALRGR